MKVKKEEGEEEEDDSRRRKKVRHVNISTTQVKRESRSRINTPLAKSKRSKKKKEPMGRVTKQPKSKYFMINELGVLVDKGLPECPALPPAHKNVASGGKPCYPSGALQVTKLCHGFTMILRFLLVRALQSDHVPNLAALHSLLNHVLTISACASASE